MSEIKRKERALLMSICMTEKVPVALGEQLIKSAEKLSYEIQSPASRVKQYEDLINFYFKKKKGE